MPAAPAGAGPVLAVAALALGGTLLPFTLFAYGQSRVSAEVAGAFYNLEPLVGAAAGAVLFGNPVGFALVGGGAAIVAGIGLSSLPLVTAARGRPADEREQTPGVGRRIVRRGSGDVRRRAYEGEPSAIGPRQQSSRAA
jgi:EamA-like transporter family